MAVESFIEKGDAEWFNSLVERATNGSGITETPSFVDIVTKKPETSVSSADTTTTTNDTSVAPQNQETVVVPQMTEDTLNDLLFSPDKPAPKTTPDKPENTVEDKITNTDTDNDNEEIVELTPEEYKADLIKTTVLKLIEDGKWAAMDGLDELEFNEDTFLQLSMLQAQHIADQHVNQFAESNEIISGIFEAHKKGLNLDNVLDLFKEQKRINDIDTQTPEGKLMKIQRFLEDVEGLPKETVKKKLKQLDVDPEALEVEFEIVEGKFQKHFKSEQDKMLKEKEEENRIQTQRRNANVRARYDVLLQSGYKESEAKKLLSQVYFDELKLEDGTPISKFDYQMLQIQQDPKKHLDLIEFVLDPEKYKKKLLQTGENNGVIKTARKISVIPQRTATAANPGASTPAKKNSLEFAQGLLKTLT